MIRRHDWYRRVLHQTGALVAVAAGFATVACGLLESGKWNREDIRQSLFPSHELNLPVSSHRVPVPVDAAFISLDRIGVARVSTGEERPLPTGSVEEVVTFASIWVASLEGASSSDPTQPRPVHAVHIAPGPSGLKVDGQPQTRELMVEYLKLKLGEAPDRPVGVDPDPDCPVEDVVKVLEVLAFAPDYGLPRPRLALATGRIREKYGFRFGVATAAAIGPVLEREPSTGGTVVLRVEAGTPYRLVDPIIDALIQARVPTVLFETAADETCRECPPPRLPGGIPWSLDAEGTGRRIETRQKASEQDRPKGVYTVKQVRFQKPKQELQPVAEPRTIEIAVTADTPLEPESRGEPEPIREPEPIPDPEPIAREAPSQPEVVRFVVGGPLTEPRRVGGPEPLYPEAARRARIQGVVVLELVIRANGEVGKVKALKGLPLGVTEAAAEAVKKWRFEPSRRQDGSAVDVLYIVTVPFRLPAS